MANVILHRAKPRAAEEILLIERSTLPRYAIITNGPKFAEWAPLPTGTDRGLAVRVFMDLVENSRRRDAAVWSEAAE